MESPHRCADNSWSAIVHRYVNLIRSGSKSHDLASDVFDHIGMLFQKESPRFLITNDRYQEGAATLSWARQLPAAHPFVAAELAEISAAVQSEANFMSGNTFGSKIKEIAFVPSVRRRYLLCITCQVFQQMTGTNAINYYAPSIFSSVGLNGTSSTLLATGVYGIVKVVATFVYVVWIIDNIGRRRPLLIGAFIQASCLLVTSSKFLPALGSTSNDKFPSI